MGAKTAILAIRIISDASKAAAGLDQVEQKTGKWAGRAEKAGKIAGGILATGVGAAALALKDGTQSAIEDAAAQAKLAQTLEKTAGASASQVKATEDWITKTALATGVADDELRPALGKLAAATGSVEKAQKLTALSMDVAAARGVSLEQVTKAVEKAQLGQVSGLSRLGIATKNAAGETITAEEAMKSLADTYGGAAATQAETLAGKQARLQVAWDEAWETLGAKLIPMLTTLAEKTMAAVTWASEHGRVVGVLAAAVGGLLATVWAVGAATKAWTAIQTVAKVATAAWTVGQKALNLAMRANPIGLVVTAIGLLIAGLVLAYNKSETFRNIVQGAMRAVRAAVQTVIDIIGVLVGWVKDKATAAWTALKEKATAVWGAITTATGNVLAAVRNVVEWVRDKVSGAFSAAKETAVNAFNAIIAPIKKAIEWVQNLIDKIANIDIPSFSDIGGGLFGGGGIFGFASTGPAPAPSLMGAASLTGAAPLVGGGGAIGGGSGQGFVQIVVQGALDPDAVARQIETILGRRARRIGAGA